MTDWQPMDTAPRDGTMLDVVVVGPSGNEIIVPKLFYGHKAMRKRPDGTIDETPILWGKQNALSSYLTPIRWRLHEE